MQSLPPGAKAGVVVLAIGTALSCAAGETGETGGATDTYDAGDGLSDGSTASGPGPKSDGGSIGAASDTGAMAESGDEDALSEDAAVTEDDALTGGSPDALTTGTPTDASFDASDDGEAAGPPPSGLSVLYQVQDSAGTSAYIGCELSVTNSGAGSPTLSGLTARYYFTNEVNQTPQITINWSHVSTSGADEDLEVTSSVVTLVPVVTDADTYIEFAFASGSSPALTPGEAAMFSWQLQGPSPSQDIYTQTNDYSFNASMTTLTSWDHVVLLQGGTVVWGLTP